MGTFIAFLRVIVSRCLVLLIHFMRPLHGYGCKCETGSLTLLIATSAARLTLRNLKRLCNLLDKPVRHDRMGGFASRDLEWALPESRPAL